MPGLIERYRDHLPFADGRPVVTPRRGLDAAGAAPAALRARRRRAYISSSRVSTRPGSFKDRGMTWPSRRRCARGREAVICASTGNTAASAAAYAARAGLRGAVIVPEGKIATGKLAQALMHGARVIALRGNFDEALELVRALADAPPDRTRQLGQPVPHRGAEDRRLRDARGPRRASWTRSASRSATPATSPPTGRAFSRGRRGAAAVRLSGRGGGAARPRPPGRRARDDRQRDPHRQPGALGGGDGRDARLARRDPRRLRRRDPRRLPPARRERGRLLRAGLGRLGRRSAEVRRRRAPRAVACVLTGHGLKDPDAALEQAGVVLPCEPQLRALERLVVE